MTPAEFRALVKRMREAQKDYFRLRGRNAMDEAIRLEREVDAELASDGQREMFE